MDGLDNSADMDHVSQFSYGLSDRDLNSYYTIAAERKAFDHAMVLFRKREAKGSDSCLRNDSSFRPTLVDGARGALPKFGC